MNETLNWQQPVKDWAQIQHDYYAALRLRAAQHPVPLPDGPDCLRDLARIGVPGAKEKLAEILKS